MTPLNYEPMNDLRDIKRLLEEVLVPSTLRHIIKEAVNVAITEVINQERDKDEDFISFLHRRSHEQRTNSNNTTVNINARTDMVRDPRAGGPTLELRRSQEQEIYEARRTAFEGFRSGAGGTSPG